MTTKPKAYMDACCFIDAVKETVGVLPESRHDDVWHIKALLEAHRAGEIEVLTSMLSIAECLAVESGQVSVPFEVQEQFRRLLVTGQYVILAPPTPRTGRMAQDLRWKHEVVLKGADGLHVATALEHQVSEFISTDEVLRKPKMAEAAQKLVTRGLRLIRASETKLLSDERLQGDMLKGD